MNLPRLLFKTAIPNSNYRATWLSQMSKKDLPKLLLRKVVHTCLLKTQIWWKTQFPTVRNNVFCYFVQHIHHFLIHHLLFWQISLSASSDHDPDFQTLVTLGKRLSSQMNKDEANLDAQLSVTKLTKLIKKRTIKGVYCNTLVVKAQLEEGA